MPRNQAIRTASSVVIGRWSCRSLSSSRTGTRLDEGGGFIRRFVLEVYIILDMIGGALGRAMERLTTMVHGTASVGSKTQ